MFELGGGPEDFAHGFVIVLGPFIRNIAKELLSRNRNRLSYFNFADCITFYNVPGSYENTSSHMEATPDAFGSVFIFYLDVRQRTSVLSH